MGKRLLLMRKWDDVGVTEQFIQDYDESPIEVRRATDKFVTILAKHGIFTPGTNAHKASATKNSNDEIWIGYITRSGSHWRVLFRIEGSVIQLERLMKHDDADNWLKRMNKAYV